MPAPNCKCLVCGKEYYFCLKCNKRRPNPSESWHINYCDENCKKLFDISNRFNFGHITKEEAEKELAECDTSKFSSFSTGIKETIKAVQKKENKGLVDAPKKEKKEEPKEIKRDFNAKKNED